MTTLFAMAIMLTLGVYLLAFDRGWFSASDECRGSRSRKVKRTVDVNQVRVDAAMAEDRMAELSGRVKEEAQKTSSALSDRAESIGG